MTTPKATTPPPTETQIIDVVNDWKSIGAGKVMMRGTAPGMMFALSTETPVLPRDVGFALPDDDNLTIDTKLNVWVRLTVDQIDGRLVYVKL